MRREVMQRHIDRRDAETKKCPKTYWRDVKDSSLEWLLRADRREIVVKDKLPPTDEEDEEEDTADEGRLSGDRAINSVATLDADRQDHGDAEMKNEL